MIDAQRKATERGKTENSWLQSWHSFSFGDWRAPDFSHYRALRVINEDLVQPQNGFELHPHRDMEILTYVLAGELEHQDSAGNQGRIRAGEWQRMSAGSGIEHREWNVSDSEAVHFLQIWLHPERQGLPPSYQQIAASEKWNDFVLVASPDGREGSLRINQDADVYLMRLSAGARKRFPLFAERGAWVQVVRGQLTLDEGSFLAGDGVAISEVDELNLTTVDGAELIIFDLA